MKITTNGTQKTATEISEWKLPSRDLHYTVDYDSTNPEQTFRNFVADVKGMVSRYEDNKARVAEIEQELVDLEHYIEIASYQNLPNGYRLYRKLAEKGLTINPKKVTTIDADTEFTFLGFKIRGSCITFSEDTLKRVKHAIRSLTKTRKGQPLKDEAVLKKVIRQINRELYVAYLQNDREFGWAEYMFGTVNVLEDIEELDRYIKDHLRHVYTGKWNSRSNYHKVPNEMLRRCGSSSCFIRVSRGDTMSVIGVRIS